MSSANRASFALDIAAFAEQFGDKADQVLRKVALDVFSRIVLRSPVDEGTFRGSWGVSLVGSPGIDNPQPDKTGQRTIAGGAAVIATASFGQTISIGSRLPYAYRLETGWSKQAPAGMVGLTVLEFEALFARAKAEVKI